MVSTCLSWTGDSDLWAVVNNAGVGIPSGPNDWITIEDHKSMIAVNLLGVIDVTLSVLPLIKKARGRVVNVASIFGRVSPFGGPYCVSKYGVEAFNDSLRLNMAYFGIKVCCIEPGFFKTAITDMKTVKKSLTTLWEKLPQDVKEDYGTSFFEKALKQCERQMSKLADGNLMKVVNCMEHAVSAVHPRTRYTVGWDAKLLWLPLSYMPTWIADRLIQCMSKKPNASVL